MSITNKPEVSRATGFAYGMLFAFVAAVAVFFLLAGFLTPMGFVVGIVAASVSAFVGLIMLLILMSLYRTRYILTDEELVIKTTFLIGGNKTIPLTTVKSVEKILMPFGIRLFGASFHGGYYYIPKLGKTFLTITNFKDGLLVKTEQKNYVITPSKPLEFKQATENRIRRLQ